MQPQILPNPRAGYQREGVVYLLKLGISFLYTFDLNRFSGQEDGTPLITVNGPESPISLERGVSELLAGVALRCDRYDIGDPMFANREEQGDVFAPSPVERVHRFCGRFRCISWRGFIAPDLLRDHA